MKSFRLFLLFLCIKSLLVIFNLDNMKIFSIFLLSQLFFFIALNVHAQEIYDLIEPVHLIAGQPDTVLISDIFYADSYNIKFLDNENVSAVFDKKSSKVIFIPRNDYEGMTLVDFEFGKKIYEIPVTSEIVQTHTFKYKPFGKPKKVSLFGSFNGWNRDNLIMKKNNEDVYQITIPLDPGRHEYKFYVDGHELLDPANPDSIPNGLGGFNSVLTIKQRHTDKIYLHILGMSSKQDSMNFSFYYEKENQKENIETSNVIALMDNQKIPQENIQISGNQIFLKFANNRLKKDGAIRLAVNQDGQYTNIQTVRLNDGKPDNNKKFSWYNAVIYSIMVDRFYDGDTSNTKPVIDPHLTAKANYMGGDLQGIIDKLNSNYFDSLGVNTLWISPVIDNTDSAFREYPKPHTYYTGYHGYWPISFTRVEERFGNMNLFKKMVETAHRHRIKILLDYVANHIHIEHPYWKEHRDWFGHLRLPNGKLNLRMWDEHRLTTWFEPFMPKFDYIHSKAALDTMTDNAVWWVKETGIDGFRHDAVKHIPNIFWRTLTKKLEKEIEIPEDKKVYQIGETFGSFKLVNSYVNNGQLDAQFNFNLYDTAIPTFIQQGSSFKTLNNQMEKSFSVFGVNNLMGNIMDSHDKVRFLAYADDDVPINSGNADSIGWFDPPVVNNPSSYKKERLYLAYLLTIPGVPVIDYGDEIGMTGASDPDNRRMMRFGNQLDNYEKEDFSDISKIIKIRDDHSALCYGDFEPLIVKQNIYAYLRSDMNERVLTVLNKSDSPETVTIEFPSFYNLIEAKDLINGDLNKIINNKISVLVGPYSYMIFKLK